MIINNEKSRLQKVVVVALFSALGYVLMLLEFPMPFLIPSFVKFDFSEVPAILAAYMYGPVAGVAVCFIKNLIKALFFSGSELVGELCNFILGCTLVLPAGLAFKKLKTNASLMIGGLSGAAIMGIMSVPVNYFLIYPFYINVMNFPLDVIIGMYQKLIPSVDGLLACLLIFNAPFTLIKGIVSVAVAYAISTKLKLVKGE